MATQHEAPGGLRRRLEALSAVGVHVFMTSCAGVDKVDHQLHARPVGPGRLFLCPSSGADVFEVGRDGPVLRWSRATGSLHGDDASVPGDATSWAAQWLESVGITGNLILVVGDEFGSVGEERAGTLPRSVHLAGDAAGIVHVLDAQLDRRAQRRVPAIDDDPSWTVELPAAERMARSAEALGALANGPVGIRGAREEDGPGSAPLFMVNGIYSHGPVPKLLAGPVWTTLNVRCASDRRILDLRTGVLLREGTEGSRLRTIRFVSAARPDAMALRAEASAPELAPCGSIIDSIGEPGEWARHGDECLARAVDPDGGGIVVATRDRCAVSTDRTVIERVTAWVADPYESPSSTDAARAVSRIDDLGFDQLLAEHRAGWAGRWADASVTIIGDAADELAARFAIFHLLSAAPDEDEAAVGARGLTGPAYGGHVFWDADVFVLPALAAIRPSAARAMLEYRLRRLPAAGVIAASQGRSGARFPWESAGDGTEVTPRAAVGRNGEPIAIQTAQHEEHIVADIAWAAAHYAAWTGDPEILTGAGSGLVVDTARYWASRLEVDDDGTSHLRRVMGPDEYHEIVDDNAYTNVMARWNLRTAAELVRGSGTEPKEPEPWLQLAESIVDGWSPDRQLYEQFAGYWDLEHLLAADAAPPPVAADMLLGAARVAGSQLIKQADVLMLYHLVPDDLVPDSLAATLAFYEPRTVHGSSLSPAVHASLFARARQPERALDMFRLAARLDIDDITGTTAGGVHLATMGGVWQALAFGFLGLRARQSMLQIDPCLPDAWEVLSLRFRFRGDPIQVCADHENVEVRCVNPLAVQIGEHGIPRPCFPPLTRFSLDRSD